MPFESGVVVPEDWRCAVIVPLYKGKVGSMLRNVEKIYAGILWIESIE